MSIICSTPILWAGLGFEVIVRIVCIGAFVVVGRVVTLKPYIVQRIATFTVSRKIKTIIKQLFERYANEWSNSV